MQFVSWNVNGFRACLGKGFLNYFNQMNADFFCLQEIKMLQGQAEFAPEGYKQYWYSADKKGYSGTAIFTKHTPLSVSYGIGIDIHDHEGRVITLEYNSFYLVTVYTPNSKRALERLDYRMQWEDDFKNYLLSLKKNKPVICCGDLNVAHQEIDLTNPKAKRKNAGFTDEERQKMTNLLNSGFIDTFRYQHPNTIEKYSWWSYYAKSRERNIGWRIDYFITSESLRDSIEKTDIHDSILGSDHCPVFLEMKGLTL